MPLARPDALQGVVLDAAVKDCTNSPATVNILIFKPTAFMTDEASKVVVIVVAEVNTLGLAIAIPLTEELGRTKTVRVMSVVVPVPSVQCT
jgi:hypothetical protein